MAKLFGDKLSSIGFFDLGYSIDNLALIEVDSKAFPALVQTYQIARGERIQTVMCFNDFIHFYVFGRKPLAGNISGFSMLKNKGLRNLIKLYDTKYRAYVATEKPFSIVTAHGESLEGIASNFIYNANAERPAIIQFSIDFLGLTPGDSALSTGGSS